MRSVESRYTSLSSTGELKACRPGTHPAHRLAPQHPRRPEFSDQLVVFDDRPGAGAPSSESANPSARHPKPAASHPRSCRCREVALPLCVLHPGRTKTLHSESVAHPRTRQFRDLPGVAPNWFGEEVAGRRRSWRSQKRIIGLFVLVGFERRSTDSVVIKPSELLSRLNAIHKKAKIIQSYLWVAERNRCWESRGLKRQEQVAVAEARCANNERDLTTYLSSWAPVQALNGR